MRKIYFFILYPLFANAQNTNQNYVKTTSYKVPTTLSLSNPSPDQAVINVKYMDGLGRISQQVAGKQSGTGKDIINFFGYDVMGRTDKEYLPYASEQSDLSFNANAEQETFSFYNSESYGYTVNPYSEKFFEASAFGAVRKMAAPGNDWIGDQLGDVDHTVKIAYATNLVSEVRFYSAQSSWNASSRSYNSTLVDQAGGYYRAASLYKKITKNENWKPSDQKNNTKEEFTDKQGRLVLIRRFESGEKIDTYYVYDQYGNLSFVFPPSVNPALAVTNSVLDGICYQYRYDERNRLSEKKLPGKQWEYMVYNKLGQVVLAGPVNSPFIPQETGWLFTKYDAFGRICYSGYYNGNAVDVLNRSALQSMLSNSASPPYETKMSAAVAVGGTDLSYSNTAFPTGAIVVLSANYYDNYAYPNAPTLPGYVYGQPVATNVNGLPTGSWEKIVGENAWSGNTSHFIYENKKFMPVRTESHFYNGGYTFVESKYDFSGKILETATVHSYAGDSETKIYDYYDYTPTQQLRRHTQEITGKQPELIGFYEYDALGVMISKRIGGTDLSGDTPYQKADYKYNVRGWLTDINSYDDLKEILFPRDLFAFHLNYTATEGVVPAVEGLFNGNIAETFWRTSTDNVLRSYGYKYDALNRLNDAYYQKPNSINAHTMSYHESAFYDKNGNILSLYRNGDMDSDMGYHTNIDDLDYAYDPVKSDRLLSVIDYTNHPGGFKDGVNADNDFAYDDFGNLVLDKNKGITEIVYNHLNLPSKIVFGSESNKIEYLYGASGKKIMKKVTVDSAETYTEYLGGFQYKNSVLSFFATSEGYVNYTPASLGIELGPTTFTPESYNYVYNYTDHLGNVRLSYGLDPATNMVKVIEENHYYPFGLKHTNYNSDQNMYDRNDAGKVVLRPGTESRPVQLDYAYKYNGKEYQDELGINIYDYGARNYDPAIGRWMNIDPLAEVSRRFSPYAYALDNPVFFIDPDGMRATTVDSGNMEKGLSSPEDSVDDNDDWYIDSVTGKVLGQDGAQTNNYRLIDYRDFNQIKADNGGSTTTADATSQLQNADVSIAITIDDAQIQQEVQSITDLSRKVEHQTQIVLNKESGKVTAKRGIPGSEGGATVDANRAKSGGLLASDGSSLLLAVAHGHNKTQRRGHVNVTGTSLTDKETAGSLGITIYATDAYNTAVGGSADVGKVTSSGKKIDNVGKTKGSGQGNFNFGLDALNDLKR